MDKKPQDTESRHADKYVLRFPDGMRDRIAAAAKINNRTMNAEIVARIQASFEPANQSGEIEVIAAERDQQRALAEQFRFIADSGDNIRTLLSAMLLGVVGEMREAGLPVVHHEWVFSNIVEWLNEKDKRGAAFSILRLIDKSSPEVVDTLRNFASHLEDLELVRKPITLTRYTGPKRKTGSVNKVILVGSLGRDPYLNYLPPREAAGIVAAVTPPNTGPVRSPNARKIIPKK